MAEVCKLLFDLSLYYALTGFYLRCISGEGPSAACFLALAACAAIILAKSAKKARPAAALVCCVAMAALLPAGQTLAALPFAAGALIFEAWALLDRQGKPSA